MAIRLCMYGEDDNEKKESSKRRRKQSTTQIPSVPRLYRCALVKKESKRRRRLTVLIMFIISHYSQLSTAFIDIYSANIKRIMHKCFWSFAHLNLLTEFYVLKCYHRFVWVFVCVHVYLLASMRECVCFIGKTFFKTVRQSCWHGLMLFSILFLCLYLCMLVFLYILFSFFFVNA